MAKQTERQSFLESQTCRLLRVLDNPRRYLTRQSLRGDARGASAGNLQSGVDDEPWFEIDRQALVSGSVLVPDLAADGDTPPPGEATATDTPHVATASESQWRLNRLVITGDGGTGKSANLRWLAWKMGADPAMDAEVRDASTIGVPSSLGSLSSLSPQSHPRLVVFVLNLYELSSVTIDTFDETLIASVRKAAGELARQTTSDEPETRSAAATALSSAAFPDSKAKIWLDRCRRRGQLALLFDGLDQIATHEAGVQLVKELLARREWDRCRIAIAGRPSALQRHWETLFEPNSDFRFVAFDEFSEDQQRKLLGERFDKLPAESRKLLKNPRILEYLNRCPDAEFGQIYTAADVYERATWHELELGLKHSKPARRIGLAPGERTPSSPLRRSLVHAQKLLGALAFEMLIMPANPGRADEGNFEQVSPGAEFDAFCQRVCRRLDMHSTEGDRRLFEHDLDALEALNGPLQQSFFESSSSVLEGLSQLLWRDRTLQEFFAAQYAVRWGNDADAAHFAPWVSVPYEPSTDEFAMVWQFAIEMPDRSVNWDSWKRVVRLLYARPKPPAPVRRANELIYRSWQRMVRHGPEVIREFQSEFQTMLDGKWGGGPEAKQVAIVAKEFVANFTTVPGGWFRMGTPRPKQGMPDSRRAEETKRYHRFQSDPEAGVRQWMSNWQYPKTKAGRQLREHEFALYLDAFKQETATAAIEKLEQLRYQADETPVTRHREVASFIMGRYPLLNAWFRLYDPNHGLRGDDLKVYQRVSGTPDQPAIFISWYDAWAFCQWAFWECKACRLPHEDEWEYACKACHQCTAVTPCPAGGPCDDRYWWGDEYRDDNDKCTAKLHSDTGATTAPRDYDPHAKGCWGNHQNRFQLVDMSGNVWEWTADIYQKAYDQRTSEERPNHSARVLRGGSWHDRPGVVRSSHRLAFRPFDCDDVTGFRVCRC